MADEIPPKAAFSEASPLDTAAHPASDPAADEAPEMDDPGARREGGLGDFVRRAVSAGFGAASRSKDDLLRVATGEIRSWLDRLDLDSELKKALAKMVVEVKAEIRFRPADDGTLQPEVTTDTKFKSGKPG